MGNDFIRGYKQRASSLNNKRYFAGIKINLQ